MPRQKGSIPWNKGLTRDDPRVANNTRGGWKQSTESREQMRNAKLGGTPWNKGLNKDNDERIKNISSKLIGREKSEETKNKISNSKKGNTPYNKGLTKITSRIVRNYSETGSNTIRQQYIDGRTPWNKNLKQEFDDRIISGRKGLTKETSINIKNGSIEQSKTMLKKYEEGLLVWNKGLTKETHPGMKSISEKRIKYMQDNPGPFISQKEYDFKDWFISLGLIEKVDFFPQYYMRDINNKYLADFYFPKIKLIIEFDGEYHHRNKLSEDEEKTNQMEEAGYKVLRFLETSKSTSKKGRREYEYAKKVLLELFNDLGGLK
jgi:hypothetical protein